MAKWFSKSEFRCRHCGEVRVTPDLLSFLDAVREKVGMPMVVTSGYRCPEHNRAVGGAKNSLHMKGQAADIVAGLGTVKRELILLHSGLEGVGGVGLYRTFVHLDVGRRRTWTDL